jgi:hypothetical protein
MKSRTAAVATALAIAASGVTAPIASARIPPTGTAGGGNCSVWASIKAAAFGVHCSFYMEP